MHKRIRNLRAIVFSSFLFMAAGCGGSGGSSGGDASPPKSTDYTPVIAQVGDVSITRGYFDYRYENLSPQDKARYSGEGWEERFLEKLVEEMLISEQADAENYDRIRDVEWRLDMARRSILYKAYYERVFQDELEIPEEELREYYERNKSDFQALGRAYGHHIVTSSKERIDEAWEKIQAGERFADVARQYSEDETTREDGGTVGWFNPGGYVLGMGFNEEFTRIAFELEPHSMVDAPVQIDDRWHIIRIGGKSEGKQQEFEEVRDRIERQLAPAITREIFDRHLRRLARERGVQRFGEFEQDPRSAEQLYRLAAESRNAHARVHYYETLVDLHPDHERADDALFMMGFLSSEEFADIGMALRAFRRLIAEYPESEFVDEAEWMMKNVGGSVGLRGDLSPTSAQDASEQLAPRQD